MVIYAGIHFSQNLGDVWELTDSSMTWFQLQPQTYGPYQLRSHAAIFNPVDTTMVVFGGVEYPGGYISDELWVLHLNSMIWTEIAPSGLWPPPTRCNYATYWPDAHKMVMYGGRLGDQRYGTTWILDLDSYTWELVQYQGQVPNPREGAPILILRGTSIMMVHGGWVEPTGYVDELWTLDLNTGEWTRYYPDYPHPIARGYCPLVYDKDNNRVLIFSGYFAYSGPGLNDLWEIKLDSMQYNQLYPTGDIPSPRGSFTTIIGGFAGHKATIFGGAQNYQLFFNDVYFLDWDVTVGIEDDSPPIADDINVSCYPNPFNTQVAIKYTLDKPGRVSISIYSLRGRKLATILDKVMPAGEHLSTWNSSNCSSGVYFARLNIGDSSKSIKMLLLK
jgi:hypothetical protein